ncbi:MAG: DinB family protein [Aridibacter sp.]
MSKFNTVISSLENSLEMLPSVIGEIPAETLKRRPQPEKWSAHEHACHLAEVHPMFFERLDLMLNNENPTIKPYFPDKHDAPDALLKVDLDDALEKFAKDRKNLIEKLKNLAPEDWQRTANHEEYSHYSIFIMFRHLSLHDYLHIYRIEELLLKKDWN